LKKSSQTVLATVTGCLGTVDSATTVMLRRSIAVPTRPGGAYGTAMRQIALPSESGLAARSTAAAASALSSLDTGTAMRISSILCPQCSTQLVCVVRATKPYAACLLCGLFGDFTKLIECGELLGGTLDANEMRQLREELAAQLDPTLRGQSAGH
jgi:hypothetical protein